MKKVKAGKSKIHGNGLIADEPIRRGDVIELVHTIREIEPGVKKTTPTLLGRNYNHSEEPNSMNVIDGNNRYLVALKEIEVGGEITTDYRNNPDLEQPDSFTSNDNYVSFDYDDTLTTPEGFKLAKQMVKDGNNLYVITARDKMSPQMIERAEAAGIPKENIILAGSDEEKVKIVKENNISKHIDNKESVIKALGKTGKLFNPGEYPDLKADFIEMDLSDDDLNQLKKGGFIIDQYPDGGQPRPVQGMAKPLAPLAIREEQVKALKNSPKVADQKKYKAIENEIKAKATIQKASKQLDELQKDALPQYEQPLTPQDWVWTLPMAGGSAMKSAGTAIADGVGALGTKAMPYLTGALETSLPFMKSIPGATVGNAIASGFATDAIVNRLPEGVTQLNNGQYIDATGNILTGVLDVAGAGMMSPLYQGAKSTASELARFLGTEEGLLSNTYKVNPWANKLNKYNRVVGQDAILDLQNSGLVRAGERGGVETGMGIRTSAYPSFGKGLPKQRYIDQTIQQGKTPYIISTNRPMGVSTLGRHGKGSTMLPIDETGKYMSEFPADETRIFGAKPNWLKGYPEVPRELPGSPNSEFFDVLPNPEIPQINPRTGLMQINNTIMLSSPLPRKFKEVLIPGYKSAEDIPEDMLPYLLPQEELMQRYPWQFMSKDEAIMNSYKSNRRPIETPYEIPSNYTTQEDIMARALGKPLPKRVSRASLEPKVYYDINGNVIPGPKRLGGSTNKLNKFIR